MITKRFKMLGKFGGRLMRRQRGFTLIELLIGLAITAAIAGAITTSIFQTIDYNARSNARMVAVKAVENAVHHISRDVQMSQIIEVEADADGFPLTLTWVEWDGSEHVVIYSLNGNDLRRQYFVDSTPTSDLVIASHIDIDPADTNCQYTDYVFYYRLTATLDGYPSVVSETREGQIKPRAA